MGAESERHLWIWYTPYGIGGVETYLLNMAREAIRDGAAVWVAATSNADGPLRKLFMHSGVQSVDWSEFHRAYMAREPDKPIRDRIITDLARIKPTLVALNDCNDFSIAAAPVLRRLQPFCTVVDTFHIDSPIDQYLDFRRAFLDTLDGISTTNQNIARRFRRRYPHASSLEVRYIPNGVALPNRPRTPIGDTLRLLYVGRLAQDQKRILELPALLDSLRVRGKAFSMTIAGDGPCREALASSLARLGLNERVRLAGYLPPQEVADLYFEHDILVNLSAFEGFSMTVLEAFAAGCVPVCTDVDSLDRSVFRDGINCRLCPVDQLEAMVDIWCSLTPESLAALSTEAQTTGRRLTAGNTYREHRRLLASLRELRPLRPWPSDAESALRLDWDLSEHNPWLPRTHPLRGLARSAWTRVRKSL